MAFSYSRTLTITSNSALLPATQTDFAVLVKISHATLKTVANGGHVNNTVVAASGPAVTMPADLIFTSDSAGTTKIPWEVDSYDGTNGILWAWVKIASCALSTVFYCFYGDAAIVAAQNTGSFTPANVWDASYQGVWHLADATTLFLNDSTANALTLTNNNTATAATGEIGGGVAVASASSQFLSRATWTQPVAITLSAWVKSTSFPNAYNTVIGSHVGGGGFADIHIKSTGKLAMYVNGAATVSYDGTGATLSTGIWYHVVLTYSSAAGLVGYLNGVSDGTAAANGALNTAGSIVFEIGQDTPFTPRFINGVIDEARASTIVRSANWITAEYNNQSDPTTFVTVGAEVPLGGSPGSNLLTLGCS